MNSESELYPGEFDKIYPLLDENSKAGDKAHLLIALRDWYISLCEFDPLSHEATPKAMSEVLVRVSELLAIPKNITESCDRFTQILSLCEQSIRTIILHPKERVQREHDLISINQVREVDNKTVHWLSRQAGKNLREKLSGKSSIYAIHRRMSLNTSENRLFKACLKRIEFLLITRLESVVILKHDIPEYQEDLLQKIEGWVNQEDVKEIQAWNNLPPNNVLLSDKNYRKMWDSWKYLRDLDENTDKDWKYLTFQYLTVIRWSICSAFQSRCDVRLLDLPIQFNYNKFELNHPESIKGIFIKNKEKLSIQVGDITESKFEISLSNECYCIEVSDNEVLLKVDGDIKGNFPQTKDSVTSITDKTVGLIFNCQGNKEKHGTSLIKCDYAALDISSWQSGIKPNNGNASKLPLRFLAQFWPESEGYDSFTLDATTSKALRTEHPIISCRDLWQEKSNPNVALVIENYVSRLKQVLETKRLMYLVPDHVSDFATESLRYQLNFAYPEATPLPKSIAAIIGLHQKGKISPTDSDLFFILDNSLDGIQITPVQAKFSNNLSKTCADTNGILWERHPSFVVGGTSDLELIKKAFNSAGDISPSFADTFSFDELFQMNGDFSFVEGETWKNLPENVKALLFKSCSNNFFDKSELEDELKGFKKKWNQVVFVSASQSVIKPEWCDLNNWFTLGEALVQSAELLCKRQTQYPDLTFWRDHLPKLSTQIVVHGRLGEFCFVENNTTVEPKRGKEVQIPTPEIFTLPSGREFYEFPLQLGKKKGKNGFLARLESENFPLEEDMSCRLALTYTYGADNPYQLKFIALDRRKSGFKTLMAKWLPYEKVVESVAPPYPEIYHWADFKAFKDSSNRDSKDLYEWLERDFNKIESNCQFLSCGESESRITIDLAKSDQFQDKKGNHCAKYHHPRHGEVFIHQNNYEKFDKNLVVISCEIERNRNGRTGYQARDITKFGEVPQLNRSYRFPMITMWKNGNSLKDVGGGIPSTFFEKTMATINAVDNVLSDKSILEKAPHSYKGELRQFMAYLHSDAPEFFTSWLTEKTKDSAKFRVQQIYNLVAYALGDLKQVWQRDILNNTINALRVNSHARAGVLESLATSVWRHSDFVKNLTLGDISLISSSLVQDIKDRSSKLTSDSKDNDWSALLRRLELILGLLRARIHEDNEIQSLLSPDSILVDKMIKVLKVVGDKHQLTINSKLGDKRSRVQCRVKFGDMQKPEVFRNTPDLLYALHIYLTGDDGANLITITGVADD